MDFSDKSVLVYDTGKMYQYVAEKLAESYGKVWYYAPWVGPVPTSIDRLIGTGIPNVERVYDWLSIARRADLIVCPFVYCHDEIDFLRSIGKPVWGAGKAESLELYRWETKQLMESYEMPVVPGELIIGLQALREYLEDKEDLYIKTSVTRGDFETRHHLSAKLSAPWLDMLAEKLGPRQHHMEFIVEEPVPGVETGYDGFNINGQYPATAGYGYEIKNAGYAMRVCDFDDLPDPIRFPNLGIARALAELRCTGFFSNEIRVSDDGTAYLIDPTMRAGIPPSASMMEMFDNWAEVIWAGAHGEVIDMHPVAKYAAEIVLKSDWVVEKTLPIFYPDDVARWVKLCEYCIIDGQRYVLPQDDHDFGFVVGLGETLEEATEQAVEHAEKIEALDLDWRHDIFDEVNKCIEKGREVGIDF